MLDKIQVQIAMLETGKKLILGVGIEIKTMQNVVELCDQLASDGIIKIINRHEETKTGQKLVDLLMIQKI
jgi:hypothetical protein